MQIRGKASTRILGSLEEDEAAAFLKDKGCSILGRNYSCKAGEIDVIYSDSEGVICFGEVKFRTEMVHGLPEEAVNNAKQRKICRASDYYRAKFSLDESMSYRYDVIAISDDGIKWIKNAFEYIER